MPGRLFVKRVAALPGDDVEWRCKQLIINSEAAFCAPLPSDQIRDLLIEEGDRHRFYREAIFGGSRVVMLHAEPGRGDIREERIVTASIGSPSSAAVGW